MIDRETVASDLLESAQAELAAAGESLREDVAAELKDVAAYLAELVERRAKGEDVEADLRHVRARVANWTWVGADRVTVRWVRILLGVGRATRIAARVVATTALPAR